MKAAYIRNLFYSQTARKTISKIFTGQKTNHRNKHIFATVCYAYKNLEIYWRLKVKKYISLGYNKSSSVFVTYMA